LLQGNGFALAATCCNTGVKLVVKIVVQLIVLESTPARCCNTVVKLVVKLVVKRLGEESDDAWGSSCVSICTSVPVKQVN